MSNDAPLFDYAESRRRKEAGMARAAANRSSMLALARDVARRLPAAREGITADDVVAALVAQGYSVHCLGNAAGALFREACWRWTGQRRASRRAHAHANELKVWRFVE